MPHYAIEVVTRKAVDLRDDAVMTITEAGEYLGLALPTVRDLLNRTRDPLTKVIDESEPNPTKATRFLRAEIEREKAARRGRRDDGRLKTRR